MTFPSGAEIDRQTVAEHDRYQASEAAKRERRRLEDAADVERHRFALSTLATARGIADLDKPARFDWSLWISTSSLAHLWGVSKETAIKRLTPQRSSKLVSHPIPSQIAEYGERYVLLSHIKPILDHWARPDADDPLSRRGQRRRA